MKTHFISKQRKGLVPIILKIIYLFFGKFKNCLSYPNFEKYISLERVDRKIAKNRKVQNIQEEVQVLFPVWHGIWPIYKCVIVVKNKNKYYVS